MIKREFVIRVYSGRSGCMCGCLGTYSRPKTSTDEDTKISETHVSRVLNFLADNKEEIRYQHISGDKWCAHIDDRNNGYETGRNHVVYYKEDPTQSFLPYDKNNLFRKDIAI